MTSSVEIGSTFRKSMAWLHTWAGVVFGVLLFAIFWMGTLSVFDQEIDGWMMPMTRRLQVSEKTVSFDATVRPVAERLAANSPDWTVWFPTNRAPAFWLKWRDASNREITERLDPATGADLNVGTYGGTGFLYPFHYRLSIAVNDIGAWMVGIASMFMLVTFVSGVVIHKKIFKDAFKFRPKKDALRARLDLHNLTGVLALPFHFFITLSGLIILYSTYFPSGWQAAYAGNREAYNREATGNYMRPKAHAPGSLGSLDAILGEARRLWGSEGEYYFLKVTHPGDANSFVEMRRLFTDRITRDSEWLFFDAASGAPLAHSGAKPVKNVYRSIYNLHVLGQHVGYNRWTLRWLYFMAGLAGCVMIATGFLFWLETRRAQHAKEGLAGVRTVEALAVGAVPGIIIATLTFFIANRLLPPGASVAGVPRPELEVWAFHLAWILSFAHAAWCGRPAWAQQSRAVAVLALAAVLLNWTTTGDHLLSTLRTGLYGVAGMDALLLLSAVIGWWAAHRMQQGNLARAATDPLVVPTFSSGRKSTYA